MPGRRRIRVRVLLYLLAFAAVLAAGGYAWLTRPARLRAAVEAALRDARLEQAAVGEVTFSPATGLRIASLVLPRAGFATTANGASLPPLLRLDGVRIYPDWFDLLRGQLRARKLEIDAAALAWDATPGQPPAGVRPGSFDVEAARLWRGLTAHGRHLPPAHVARADIDLLVVERGRPRLLERSVVQAGGRPDPDGYALRITSLPGGGRVLAEAGWSSSAGELRLALTWLRIDLLQSLLPVRLAELVGRCELGGRARLEEAVFRAETPATGPAQAPLPPVVYLARGTLRLDELHGAIPIEDVPQSDGGGKPFLHVAQGSATLRYSRPAAAAAARCGMELDGTLNGAPLKLRIEAGAQLLAGTWVPPGFAPETLLASGPPGLKDVDAAELELLGFELPTETEHPGFTRARRLPGPVRCALRDYHPRGRVNVRLRILPASEAATGADNRIAGEVEALGAACRYKDFPYPFTDAQGRLVIAGGQVRLDGLSGRHGSAHVHATGVINSTREWTGFDLEFRGVDVPLDADLYGALREPYRQLWHTAAPLGLCDVVTHVWRPDGSPQTGAAPAEVEVDATLLGGSLALEGGRRLEQADGRFSIHGSTIEIHDLHGYQDGAAVRLTGQIRPGAEGPQADVRVTVHDLPIVEQAALAAGGATTAQVRFEGRADAWGRVQEIGGPDGRHEHFAVHIKAGELHALDPARPWRDSTGWAVVRDGLRRILNFRCRQGQSWFEAAGVLPETASDARAREEDADRVTPPASAPLALDLRAHGPNLETLVPQFVPSAWTNLSRALGLSGAGDVTVLLRPGGVESPELRPLLAGGQPGDQTADIQVRAARMQAESWPLELRDVAAHLTLSPGRFELRSSDARWGTAGEIRADGQGTWEDAGVTADLHVGARGLCFGPELNAGLPPPLARLLERLGAQGEFDAVLNHVRLAGWRQDAGAAGAGAAGANAGGTITVEGRLPLRDARLALGLPLEIARGEVEGTFTLGPGDQVALDAAFELERGRVAGRSISGWQGRLHRAPGERWVRLEELRGRLCDGEAVGTLWIDPQSSDYELSLTIKDVAAAQFLPGTASPGDRDEARLASAVPANGAGRSVPPSTDTGAAGERPGRLDGRVSLRGRGGTAAGRRGGGELRLRGASFLKTPVLESVSRAGGVEPISDEVERADVEFLWEGSELRLRRIEIQSRDLRLIGEGTWDLADNTVRLTLWGAHPRRWLEQAWREIVQYRVEGPLGEPRVTTEPLYKLNETLRALLGAE